MQGGYEKLNPVEQAHQPWGRVVLYMDDSSPPPFLPLLRHFTKIQFLPGWSQLFLFFSYSKAHTRTQENENDATSMVPKLC